MSDDHSLRLRHLSYFDANVALKDILHGVDKDLWSNHLRPKHVLDRWTQSKQLWTIYCSGPPRSGKSTFTAIVAEWLLEKQKISTQCTAVVTIFLDLLDLRGELALETILRAILRQLIETDVADQSDTLLQWEQLHRARCDKVRSGPILAPLLKIVQSAAQRFERVFFLIDGVNQRYAPDEYQLVRLMSHLQHASIMFVGPSNRLWSPRTGKCALAGCKLPKQDLQLQLWASCEPCRSECCEVCFKANERCCELMVGPKPIVEITISPDGRPHKAYIERRLRSTISDKSLLGNAARFSESIIGESGKSFAVAWLATEHLIETQAFEEVQILRDRMPDIAYRYLNLALWRIRSQPSASDVALGLAAVALVSLAGDMMLSLAELQAALKETSAHLRKSRDEDLSLQNLARSTQGWLVREYPSDQVGFFTKNAESFLQSEYADFYKLALPELPDGQDFAQMCLRALTNPQTVRLFEEMANAPYEHLTTLDKYPFIQYAFAWWPRHFEIYSTPATVESAQEFFRNFERIGMNRLCLALAGSGRKMHAVGHPLHVMAEFGFGALIDDYKDNFDVVDPGTGRTPAMVAAAAGNIEMLRSLIVCGVDPVTRLSLQKPANLRLRCKSDRTALGYAIRKKDPEIIKCLLKYGPPGLVNGPEEGGDSHLMLAIHLQWQHQWSKWEPVTAALLSAKDLDFSERDAHGKTVLHRTSDLVYLPGIQLILGKEGGALGVNLTEDNATGRTSLMNVVHSVTSSVSVEARLDAVNILLDKGANLSIRDQAGRQLVHYLASSDEHVSILKSLVKRRTAIEGELEVANYATDKLRRIASDKELDPEAAKARMVELKAAEDKKSKLEASKTRAVSLDTTDSKGWTPLHYACAHDCPDTVAFLRSQHCSLDVESHDGLTPLAVAENVHSIAVIGQLTNLTISTSQEEASSMVTSRQQAARASKDLDVLGRNELHVAVQYAQKLSEVASAMKTSATQANIQDAYGQTALHLALRRLVSSLLKGEDDPDTAQDIVMLLIESKNCDFDIIDHWQERPLDVALRDLALRDDTEAGKSVVFAMLAAGAKFHRTPHNIDQLFEIALLRDPKPSITVFQALLDAGADILLQINQRGKFVNQEFCAWQIARDRGFDSDILHLLEDHERQRSRLASTRN